jgi:hypothetical protein
MPGAAGAGANPYVQVRVAPDDTVRARGARAPPLALTRHAGHARACAAQVQPQMGGMGAPSMGGRPGTGAMRQAPGSRQGTAAAKSFGGIGLNTQIAVENRPMTGMRGSTAAGARLGPGRQIQVRTALRRPPIRSTRARGGRRSEN